MFFDPAGAELWGAFQNSTTGLYEVPNTTKWGARWETCNEFFSCAELACNLSTSVNKSAKFAVVYALDAQPLEVSFSNLMASLWGENATQAVVIILLFVSALSSLALAFATYFTKLPNQVIVKFIYPAFRSGIPLAFGFNRIAISQSRYAFEDYPLSFISNGEIAEMVFFILIYVLDICIHLDLFIKQEEDDTDTSYRERVDHVIKLLYSLTLVGCICMVMGNQVILQTFLGEVYAGGASVFGLEWKNRSSNINLFVPQYNISGAGDCYDIWECTNRIGKVWYAGASRVGFAYHGAPVCFPNIQTIASELFSQEWPTIPLFATLILIILWFVSRTIYYIDSRHRYLDTTEKSRISKIVYLSSTMLLLALFIMDTIFIPGFIKPPLYFDVWRWCAVAVISAAILTEFINILPRRRMNFNYNDDIVVL